MELNLDPTCLQGGTGKMEIKHISALVFIFTILLVLGLYSPKIINQQEFSRRFSRIVRKKELEKKDQQTKSGGIRGVFDSLYRAVGKLLITTRLKRWVERELTKADLPLRGEEFIAFSLVGIGLAIIAVILLSGSFLITMTVMIILLPAPHLFIQRSRQKRLAKLNSQIGDALMIIANSLRSGFSFLQAMELVRKEMPDPIAREFGRTFQEVNLGTPTEQALQNMVERVGSDDLEMVITAVLIQRQVGGNLAEVLDNIAHTMRERIRIKGEIKSLTAQGRISGVVVGLLPVALAVLLFILNPDYISLLFTSPIGLSMVGAALIAQTSGFLIIKRIVDIKY